MKRYYLPNPQGLSNILLLCTRYTKWWCRRVDCFVCSLFFVCFVHHLRLKERMKRFFRGFGSASKSYLGAPTAVSAFSRPSLGSAASAPGAAVAVCCCCCCLLLLLLLLLLLCCFLSWSCCCCCCCCCCRCCRGNFWASAGTYRSQTHPHFEDTVWSNLK